MKILFNFNETPMVPPETKGLVFVDPETRDSWQVHSQVFLCGALAPALLPAVFFKTQTESYFEIGTY